MTESVRTSIMTVFKPKTVRTGSGMSLCYRSNNFSMIEVMIITIPDAPDGVLNTMRVQEDNYYISYLVPSIKIIPVYMRTGSDDGVRSVRGINNHNSVVLT